MKQKYVLTFYSTQTDKFINNHTLAPPVIHAHSNNHNGMDSRCHTFNLTHRVGTHLQHAHTDSLHSPPYIFIHTAHTHNQCIFIHTAHTHNQCLFIHTAHTHNRCMFIHTAHTHNACSSTLLTHTMHVHPHCSHTQSMPLHPYSSHTQSMHVHPH